MLDEQAVIYYTGLDSELQRKKLEPFNRYFDKGETEFAVCIFSNGAIEQGVGFSDVDVIYIGQCQHVIYYYHSELCE